MSRAPQRPPGEYRPDLRPMLILVGLLAAVLIGWILLSGLVLPGDERPAGVAGTSTRPIGAPTGVALRVDDRQ